MQNNIIFLKNLKPQLSNDVEYLYEYFGFDIDKTSNYILETDILIIQQKLADIFEEKARLKKILIEQNRKEFEKINGYILKKFADIDIADEKVFHKPDVIMRKNIEREKREKRDKKKKKKNQ